MKIELLSKNQVEKIVKNRVEFEFRPILKAIERIEFKLRYLEELIKTNGSK